MKKIRIFFNYKHISEPWGGANNFIRALHHELMESGGFEFADHINDNYDILFMNELGMGPGNGSRRIAFRKIKKLRVEAPSKRIVVRAVNLIQHAYKLGLKSYIPSVLLDRATIKLLNIADFVIFQSEYQKSFFIKYGYKGKKSIVIHNGADDQFISDRKRPSLGEGSLLRIVSSTASPRRTKRHDLIARMSEISNVEMIHLGRWPDDIDNKGIVLKGVLTTEEMKEIYCHAHYFFHPAFKDPCPNAIFEAILSGLPVIYNADTGSSAEILRDNGLPINESNMNKTIEEARGNYYFLVENVRKTKGYYSIKRATSSYVTVLKRIVEL